VCAQGAELLNPKKLWARLLSVVRNYASLFQVRKLLKKEKYPTSAWLIVGRWTAEVGVSLPHSLCSISGARSVVPMARAHACVRRVSPLSKAADHYRAFCEARANGNTQALRKLATDEFYDVRISLRCVALLCAQQGREPSAHHHRRSAALCTLGRCSRAA
jgi:hypothetical protein